MKANDPTSDVPVGGNRVRLYLLQSYFTLLTFYSGEHHRESCRFDGRSTVIKD
jgi:hypothetical protein